MGKNKLAKFAENKTFSHVIQPQMDEILNQGFGLKGKWHEKVFGNQNPIVLELGCGKGEYAVNLAQKYPNKNFIGIDIKGARIWRGAKSTQERGLLNIRFLRSRIEFVDKLFGENEVDEIWITFPDPQAKTRRAKKRLTHPRFLEMYRNILRQGGLVHLKTDSMTLYLYTSGVLKLNNLTIRESTPDLYNSDLYKNELQIKTHYEALFLEGNPTITYLQFNVDSEGKIEEPETDNQDES